MTTITFFRHTRPLPAPGVVTQAGGLPQDETTAAVLLAALLARDHEHRGPGEYGAVIDLGDGTRPIVITEDDPRVMIARGMLLQIAPFRSNRAGELARVRNAIITAPWLEP